MNFAFYLAVPAFLLSTGGTYWFIRYALQSGILDHPNTRSSHSIPTPRGGGAVFSLVTICGWCILALAGYLPASSALSLLVPGTVMVVTGYFDDRHNLSRRVRLGSQVLATALLLYFSHLPSGPDFKQTATFMVSGLAIVWFINLYNFMDGIDGIAAAYGITICVLAALLLFEANRLQLIPAIALIAAPLAGFILFNWPPAKVFMGDSGSTFLGISFAALVILTSDTIDWVSWAILFAAFLGDATWTLLTRFFTRQKWAQAHRSHAYQKLAPNQARHRSISILYSLYTVIWLFPVIYLHHHFGINSLASLVLAYAPVIALCMKVSAGKK